jgi:hypothetical protein
MEILNRSTFSFLSEARVLRFDSAPSSTTMDDSDDALEWLSTMAVPYRPTPRTPTRDVSPTTPIGFSPAAYRRLVRSHQTRLREVNEEYRRLQ